MGNQRTAKELAESVTTGSTACWARPCAEPSRLVSRCPAAEACRTNRLSEALLFQITAVNDRLLVRAVTRLQVQVRVVLLANLLHTLADLLLRLLAPHRVGQKRLHGLGGWSIELLVLLFLRQRLGRTAVQ